MSMNQNEKDNSVISEDTGISIEEANKQNQIINDTKSKDYSQASTSEIKSVDEDESEKREQLEKLKSLSKLLGIDQHREELDKLNQSVQYLADKMSEIAQVVDAQTAILNKMSGQVSNPGATPAVPAANDQMDKIQAIGSLVESLKPILDKVWPSQTAQAPGIPGLDPQSLMSEAVEAVKDDFAIGKELRQAIKSSIRNKTVSNVVKSTLRPIDHGP